MAARHTDTVLTSPGWRRPAGPGGGGAPPGAGPYFWVFLVGTTYLQVPWVGRLMLTFLIVMRAHLPPLRTGRSRRPRAVRGAGAGTTTGRAWGRGGSARRGSWKPRRGR